MGKIHLTGRSSAIVLVKDPGRSYPSVITPDIRVHKAPAIPAMIPALPPGRSRQNRSAEGPELVLFRLGKGEAYVLRVVTNFAPKQKIRFGD
jgi:hypothetical protein